MSFDFLPDQTPRFTDHIPENAYLLIHRGRELLTVEDGEIPQSGQVSVKRGLRIGEYRGIPCYASSPDDVLLLPGSALYREAREIYAAADPAMRYAAARAKMFLFWRKTHRFCGACGKPLQECENDEGLICPECGNILYPQIAPAVITAIIREDGKILLAHNRNFRENVYSLIAGFVESGETLEQAVVREIREEAGIEVKNVRYLYSQPWPFPNSLMLGFMADYASGEPRPDGTEISDVGWFTKDDHPELPKPGSIARRILDEIFSGKLSAR